MKKAFGVLAVFLGTPAWAADAPHWQVLNDKSTIEWTAQYGGKPVTGSFPRFMADIAFDPAHPETGRAAVKIETANVKSEDKDAQSDLPLADWFAAAKYPLATFESNKFRNVTCDPALGTSISCHGGLQMEGNLTVRDKSIPVTIPFTVNIEEDNSTSPPARYARVDAATSVKRTALGVGQGDWASTDTIADDVKITIHLEAKQVP